ERDQVARIGRGAPDGVVAGSPGAADAGGSVRDPGRARGVGPDPVPLHHVAVGPEVVYLDAPLVAGEQVSGARRGPPHRVAGGAPGALDAMVGVAQPRGPRPVGADEVPLK